MANGSGPPSELGHGGGDDAAPGPDGQPRAGRAWYGAGRAAAEEEEGGATASGENEQQNGVAAQGSQAAAANPGSLPPGDPLQVQDPWNPGSTGLERSEAATWQTRSWEGSWGQRDWNHGQWEDREWSARDWRGADWRWGQWGNSYNSKPDMIDPPTWPGWSHRRLWIQAVRRWDKQTDIPLHKRADRILRSLGWDLQSDFEHLDEEVLSSSLYLDAIIEVMNAKAGVREDDEKRRAYRQAITENQRHREESLHGPVCHAQTEGLQECGDPWSRHSQLPEGDASQGRCGLVRPERAESHSSPS